MRPSVKTSVFTASPSASSQRSAAARLCGIVTLAPAKPPRDEPAHRSSSRSGGTSSATYAQSSARAANAAFCIRGDSECATGWPISATRRVDPPNTSDTAQWKPYWFAWLTKSL